MTSRWHLPWMGALTALLAVHLRAELRVTGSDLLGLEFTQSFYEFSVRKGFKLAVALDGSRPGLEELKEGRADLSLMVLPPEELGRLAPLRAVPLGYHAIRVLVAEDCPLEKISLDQLRRTFGTDSSATGNTRLRWQDLGARGEWGGAFVTLVAPEVGAGVMLEYFTATVLRERPLRAEVERFSGATELRAFFPESSRAIALAPVVPLGSRGIRALRIATADGDSGVGPTLETIHAGTYPLRLPVQVVFRPERTRDLAPLFEFLFGDTAAALLERAEVSPLPDQIRAEQLKTYGTGSTSGK